MKLFNLFRAVPSSIIGRVRIRISANYKLISSLIKSYPDLLGEVFGSLRRERKYCQDLLSGVIRTVNNSCGEDHYD